MKYKKSDVVYKWKETYSYIIPSICTGAYIIYLVFVYFGKFTQVLQCSRNFDEMLKTIVTFMSIILSVFGFLIPSFLSGKGKGTMVSYFLENADKKLFAVKLKNVVAFGLIDIFLTCVLLIDDILAREVTDVIIVIWMWILFYFLCSAYRFIGLIVNLIIIDKEHSAQKIGNEIPDEEKAELDKKIKSI